jgi:D-3-phosphoglycerate dehydrogenase
MTVKILVALQSFGEFSDAPKRLLQNSGAEILYNNLGHRLTRDEIIRLGAGCHAIIAGVEPYDQEVLRHLPDLRCISRSGVGTDTIDLNYAKTKGIAILNTPDVVVQPVAEMTLAMIFDLLRHLTFHTTILKDGQWNKRAGHLLGSRKVGIIGLGRIGRRVAELCRALNAEVTGYDLYPDHSWASKHGIRIVDLRTLLEDSDIISVHVSLSSENPFTLGKTEFGMMKPSAILINTSRGQVIDETVLFDALKSGHLGGAALDVFRNEPYDGPLCTLDNVVLTPHISTFTVESRAEMERDSVMNALKFLNLPVRE